MKGSEGEVRLRFALEPDPGVSAVVRTPDGKPAAGAQVAWATPSREVTGRGATLSFSGHAERLGGRVVVADAEGRVRLPSERYRTWSMSMVLSLRDDRSPRSSKRPGPALTKTVVKRSRRLPDAFWMCQSCRRTICRNDGRGLLHVSENIY